METGSKTYTIVPSIFVSRLWTSDNSATRVNGFSFIVYIISNLLEDQLSFLHICDNVLF